MAVMVANAQVINRSDSTIKVNIDALPKAIKDNIAKDYVGYTIKDAAGSRENNRTTYEVLVAKGVAVEVLVYDNEGKFVKKLPWDPKK
jgi:transcriptional/translational regulatory protein YebC/TACO1